MKKCTVNGPTENALTKVHFKIWSNDLKTSLKKRMAVNFWSVFVRDLDGLPPHASRQKPIFRTYCGVKLLSIKHIIFKF